MRPDITPPATSKELAAATQRSPSFDEEPRRHTSNAELADEVSQILQLDRERAAFIVAESERLYVNRMRERFSKLRVSERLKRTNPFLLRIRGAETVRDWATLQVQSALYASEEEAVGHLLEAIIKACFPGATEPALPDDFDFESIESDGAINGYQVKMSWDCMPMSSRKNLSNTIVRVKEQYRDQGKSFVGYFAPCYGRATTTKPPGQEYITLASKEFWQRVGNGDPEYDVRVGEVCALLCSEFRTEVLDTLVPDLLQRLTLAAQPEIGDREGRIDYARLFRRVNK
ncbi:PmeII family type II restriction endonuclease [Streptomyces sp. LaPpAH-108]|uniref:PmeII family type II restriction endonuclease n=1 Tax=Streptomyces sp. LaPpAH-108 TaxID=1155714 RepID=UPI0009987B31|nr:PmeII family type II restriction endonuclease [Streptomyces sp. LaPpAH-108]